MIDFTGLHGTSQKEWSEYRSADKQTPNNPEWQNYKIKTTFFPEMFWKHFQQLLFKCYALKKQTILTIKLNH